MFFRPVWICLPLGAGIQILGVCVCVCMCVRVFAHACVHVGDVQLLQCRALSRDMRLLVLCASPTRTELRITAVVPCQFHGPVLPGVPSMASTAASDSVRYSEERHFIVPVNRADVAMLCLNRSGAVSSSSSASSPQLVDRY